MANYIKRVRTDVGDLQIDYESLANLPKSDTTLSKSGEFADSKAVGDAILSITPETIGAINVKNIVNSLDVTEEGYVLDARVGPEIKKLILERPTVFNYSSDFLASNWSENIPYTQTVDIEGISSTDDPFVDVNMSNVITGEEGELLSEAWSFIGRVETNNGSVTAYCYTERPKIDIPILLKVVK